MTQHSSRYSDSELDDLERDMRDGEWKSLIKGGFDLIADLREARAEIKRLTAALEEADWDK